MSGGICGDAETAEKENVEETENDAEDEAEDEEAAREIVILLQNASEKQNLRFQSGKYSKSGRLGAEYTYLRRKTRPAAVGELQRRKILAVEK